MEKIARARREASEGRPNVTEHQKRPDTNSPKHKNTFSKSASFYSRSELCRPTSYLEKDNLRKSVVYPFLRHNNVSQATRKKTAGALAPLAPFSLPFARKKLTFSHRTSFHYWHHENNVPTELRSITIAIERGKKIRFATGRKAAAPSPIGRRRSRVPLHQNEISFGCVSSPSRCTFLHFVGGTRLVSLHTHARSARMGRRDPSPHYESRPAIVGWRWVVLRPGAAFVCTLNVLRKIGERRLWASSGFFREAEKRSWKLDCRRFN